MESNIIIVSSHNAKVGMVLAKSILKDGKVLIYRNSPLKENDIIKLKRENIVENLFVYENIQYSTEKYSDIPDTSKQLSYLSKINNLETIYNGLSETLTSIFYKLKMFQETTNEEVRNFCSNLLSQTNDTGAVIHDIVLNGSSNSPLYRHSINVALLSNLLGRWINLKPETLNLLTYSALLHDIGKTKINEKILNKKTALTIDERAILETHPILGYKIVRGIAFLDKSVAQGILFHHEKYDGSGYPFSLSESKITTFSKIIAIADKFDNCNSNHGIQKKNNPFKTIEILKEECFSSLDYNYCNIFINNILNFFIGKDVLLSNGQTGQIILMNINNLDLPLVNINNEFIDLSKSDNLAIDKFIFA